MLIKRAIADPPHLRRPADMFTAPLLVIAAMREALSPWGDGLRYLIQAGIYVVVFGACI
jgi:hypothetical protein